MKYYAPTKLSENISETPEGFLLCIGVLIARTGDMDYAASEVPTLDPNENGIITITRSDEDVFRPETIASFEGKPLTIQHPEDFVDPDNWKDLAKGIMQNVRRGEGEARDSLVCDLLITDSEAISLVKGGLRGLSCGYEAEYAQTEQGKGTQTNIIGNHLALVEEGRAGPAYAINDKKGAFSMSKFADKMKSVFSKAVDEAMKEEEAPKKEAGDAGMYDELVQICKDLGEKIDAMKPKDEADPKKADPKKEDPKKEEENNDAEEVAPALEDRLKKLEELVAKLMQAESAEGEMGDDDMEEADDEDMPEKMTGDTLSRAEILAPGIEESKDIKVNALKTAYGTKDGKQVIDALTGGKAPAFDSPEKMDALFISASEVLKVKRGTQLSKTKTSDYSSTIFDDSSKMTAEKMNEINAKKYNLK